MHTLIYIYMHIYTYIYIYIYELNKVILRAVSYIVLLRCRLIYNQHYAPYEHIYIYVYIYAYTYIRSYIEIYNDRTKPSTVHVLGSLLSSAHVLQCHTVPK